MIRPTKQWTVEQVRALPGYGGRYELIDGQLYVDGMIVPDNDLAAFKPPPEIAESLLHERVCGALYQSLASYTATEKIGETLTCGREVTLVPGTVHPPDVVVLPFVEGRRAPQWPVPQDFLLVVAVVSSKTAHADHVVDREWWRRAGVPEYWAVDINSGVVDRWRPHEDRPERAEDVLQWRPAGAASSLRIDLEALYSMVRDVG